MSAARYAQAALAGEIQRVRQSAAGGRAEAVYRAAKSLGQLVGGGFLTRDAVEPALLDAARDVGLPSREAAANVQRGLQRGEQKPRLVADRTSVQAQPPTLKPAPVPTPTSRRHAPPPGAEVEALWRMCVPVTEDAAAAAYLATRGLAPDAVALWDLARTLPLGARAPWWASCESIAWSLSGHRLIVRTFDAQGCFASVRARAIVAKPAGRKELAPAGHSATGLVLACPLAVQVLKDGPPTWWTDHAFVVSEGTPDWLTWASRQSDAHEQGPAYFGIGSGFWTAEIAARIPDGARVVIRTHHDAAGDGFAKQVLESLRGRCQVLRA